MEAIIKTIKNELKIRNITYDEFSKMTFIPSGTLRNIFSNRGINPRIDTVNIMLSALGLHPYEKTPQGTYLTELERTIIDVVTSCDEHQQELILAYATGLREKRNLQSVVIKREADNDRNAK